MNALNLLVIGGLLLGAACPSVAQDVRLEGIEDRSELIQIFDGKSLDGWRGATSLWTAKDEVLIGRTEQPLVAAQYLITEKGFVSFRLLAEARLVTGKEFVIAFGRGCLNPELEAKFPQSRILTLTAEMLKSAEDEWVQLEILIVGQRTRLAINGRDATAMLSPQDAQFEFGPIAFVLNPSNEPQEVRLRNVVIETNPGTTFQTVKDDVPPPITIRELERNVDPNDSQLEHWTKLTEALVPDELLQPTRGTRLPLTSMGVRDVERDAYYALVQKARELPLGTLQRAANEWSEARRALPEHRRYARLPLEKFPLFSDLFRNPTAYHGKLVTLRGHVRRLDEIPADENPYGIEKLYQVWLYDEHAQSNPTVIVCTSLDSRLKAEPETLINNCRVTGYFFKNMAYDGQRDLRFAPLLIGQKLEYFPAESSGQSVADSLLTSLAQATGMSRRTARIVVMSAMCVLSLLVVIWMQRRPRRAPLADTSAAPSFSNVPDNGNNVSFDRLPQADAEPAKPSENGNAV